MTLKPLILAVETSSRIGSVAIALGEELLSETTFSAPIRHSAEIFPAICSILDDFGRKPGQIEHIYISIGPGSFTGLRIAVTIAKSMHLANNVKTIPVCTTDVIAANVIELNSSSPETIATIIDAKRSQFFITVYKRTSDERRETSDEIWKKTLPDSLMTASQFLDRFAAADKPIWLLGDGLLYYKDKFKANGIRFLDEKYWSPRAANVHSIGWKKALDGQFADPLTLTPFYLRTPQVTIKPR